MHQVDCPVVDGWLSQGAQCTDGALYLFGRSLVPGVQAVVCCSEGAAGQSAKVLRTVQSIVQATRARHSLGMRYFSKIPRLVTIAGDTANQQLQFQDGPSAPAPDLGRSVRLTSYRQVRLVQKSRSTSPLIPKERKSL